MATDVLIQDTGLHDLRPLFFGCEECMPGHCYGPAVREYYLIHYILSGRGMLQCGGQTYSVEPGQCFLICPGDITFYNADDNDPWHYVWVAFQGALAGRMLNMAGLDVHNPVFQTECLPSVFGEIHQAILHNTYVQAKADYYILSRLYAILDSLPRVEPKTDASNRYVERAKNYIASLYCNNISIERLAASCGLDRRYLCRLFKEKTGRTLQQYLIDMRLERANVLLQESGLSVSDISRSVGYQDVYNFSKMFKKKYGKSPMQLRRQTVME